MTKLNFSYHYSSLQCHMIPQKSFSYADLVLNKHFLLLPMLKTVVLFNIFLKTVMRFFQDLLMLKFQKNSIYWKYNSL